MSEMIYRTLPHGGEQISVIGLGMGYIHENGRAEAEATVRMALDRGVNYLDLAAGDGSAYPAVARAIDGRREQVYVQMHFGAVYDGGAYGWTRDLRRMKNSFASQLRQLGTDYTDMGFVHCIDEDGDFDGVMRGGLWDYMKGLKADGVIRHLGLSTHDPSILRRFLETGLIDMAMFSINPAYDVMDENAPRPKKLDSGFFNDIEVTGVNSVREELYSYCEANGIGITVMKTLAAGALLDARTSPFGAALTVPQCIHYALTRPGVASVLLGMQSVEQVADCLSYENLDDGEKDYSFIFSKAPKFSMNGRCVYCNHCLPCSAHIDIAQVNKYLDMACLDDTPMATLKEHYHALEHNADECIACHACESRCPFGVDIVQRMMKAREMFR